MSAGVPEAGKNTREIVFAEETDRQTDRQTNTERRNDGGFTWSAKSRRDTIMGLTKRRFLRENRANWRRNIRVWIYLAHGLLSFFPVVVQTHVSCT